MIQTVTEEQAKKIRKLGIEIDTTWCWIDIYQNHPQPLKLILTSETHKYSSMSNVFAAPQAEEILDRMPEKIEVEVPLNYQLRILKSSGIYCVAYVEIYGDIILYLGRDKFLSVAVGDMFIWLAETYPDLLKE